MRPGHPPCGETPGHTYNLFWPPLKKKGQTGKEGQSQFFLLIENLLHFRQLIELIDKSGEIGDKGFDRRRSSHIDTGIRQQLDRVL